MKKVIILTAILVLAITSVTWATPPLTGPRITYGGYVEKNTQGLVTADTLITVFNPNNFVLNGIGITVYDNNGIQVADGVLLNNGGPVSSLPAKGWGWQTIGHLIPTPLVPVPATKYTFVVYWTKPTTTPHRAVVIEIKEIIYTQPVYPSEGAWMPTFIRLWSEAALGGKKGTGWAEQ